MMAKFLKRKKAFFDTPIEIILGLIFFALVLIALYFLIKSLGLK